MFLFEMVPSLLQFSLSSSNKDSPGRRNRSEHAHKPKEKRTFISLAVERRRGSAAQTEGESVEGEGAPASEERRGATEAARRRHTRDSSAFKRQRKRTGVREFCFSGYIWLQNVAVIGTKMLKSRVLNTLHS